MRKTHTIPFIFATTGHRDICAKDVPKLEATVKELFEMYLKKYPHTELILLTALAEGADMLVANVAKSLGITLHVVLPYAQSDYVASFKEEGSSEEFLVLKEYASKVEVRCADLEKDASECYQDLGEYLADTSNILIALWDGVTSGYKAGTSAIVNYTRLGFEMNRFDALDGNSLIIITTPRRSNPDVETDFLVKYECLGKHVKGDEFAKMLGKIDSLNKETTIEKLEDSSVAKTYMKHFGEKARKNQWRNKFYSIVILLLTFVAVACLEIMHVLHIEPFIVGYGVGLLLAFGVYHFFMDKGKVQDNFVYSRGFAEALRIQNAWNHAGLGKSVARYYLYNQHYKFVWLKVVLKNLYYLDKAPFYLYATEYGVMSWIDEQIEYFKQKSKERHIRLEIVEFMERRFYRWGLISLVLMFVIYVAEATHTIEHSEWWFNWHYLVLVSGLLLMAAAIMGERYSKIMGYEDEIYHFNVMLENFLDAKKMLKGVDKKSEKYQEIIYDLGIKALNENRAWVVMHDKMRAEPSFE